jgi:hypothetical protein
LSNDLENDRVRTRSSNKSEAALLGATDEDEKFLEAFEDFTEAKITLLTLVKACEELVIIDKAEEEVNLSSRE